MNRTRPWLMLWDAFWLLVIALAPVLPGPKYFPPSWQTLYAWLPDWLDWLWPTTFGVAAVTMASGSRGPRGLILGYIVGALAFIVWGCMSSYVWLTEAGGSLPGSAVYFLVAGTQLMLAHNAYQGELVERRVSRIEESADPVLLDRATTAACKDE